MELIQSIQAVPILGPYVPYMMIAITIASLLAPVVPPEWPVLYRLINIIASNVGQARNASDPKVNR
jgi:hypothetical protein